jgi:hypothetical protein
MLELDSSMSAPRIATSAIPSAKRGVRRTMLLVAAAQRAAKRKRVCGPRARGVQMMRVFFTAIPPPPR